MGHIYRHDTLFIHLTLQHVCSTEVQVSACFGAHEDPDPIRNIVTWIVLSHLAVGRNSLKCWMPYSQYFPLTACLPWLCLFLICRVIKLKKKKKDQTAISVYCALVVCIFLEESFECFHPSNRAVPCFVQLFPLHSGLMLKIGLLDAVLWAHVCSMGWISIMSRLFPLKTKTMKASGNTQPLGPSCFPMCWCLCVSYLAILLKNNMLEW